MTKSSSVPSGTKKLPQRSGQLNQSSRFIETARVLGADEDEAAFKAKLNVIARQKPKEPAPEAPKKAPKSE